MHFDPDLFFHAVYFCEDVDDAVGLLSRNITDILDVMAPMKTFQVRTNYSPWISKETVTMMKERDELQKLASETKSRDDWCKYKQARNRVNNRLKYEEKKGQKLRLDECGTNSAKTWKNVKCILNWNSSGSPNQLFYKGSLRTKAQDIADSQNEFFIDKVQDILANMAPPASDPLRKLKSLMLTRKCSFELVAVHPDQVNKIISSLNKEVFPQPPWGQDLPFPLLKP